MTISFVRGPHSQMASAATQKQLATILADYDSTEWHINWIYNNFHHFSSPLFHYDTEAFLSDIMDVVKSPDYELIVMGDVHEGDLHSSGMIGQYTDQTPFQPCLVRDIYIRFRIAKTHNLTKPKAPLSHNYREYRELSVLQESVIYHFLMKPPHISIVQNKSFPYVYVWMQEADKRLVPSFEHEAKKKYQLVFFDNITA